MRRAIALKRDGAALDARTWHDVVAATVARTIDEPQLAALLMTCVLRGLDDRETRALTDAFVASGDRLDAPDPRTVDKHSSGGVADTASLVVVPLVAACGVPVAKLSGRALGHTGGTLDKLEAIDGVRTELDPERFFAIVRDAGCAIAAQGPRLVPADKIVYALRDRTATVPSRGLIAASIVSKKIAGGAHAIVYDVKCGTGAFLQDATAARELAVTLVSLTQSFGRRSFAVVSDMNEPLGTAIGTGLEAIEARDFLAGTQRDPRLAALCHTLAATMLRAAGLDDTATRLEGALESGRAFETFERMLALQGARAGALAALQPDPRATGVRAERSGFVDAIAPVQLGELARDLVARSGPGAGIRMHVRTGDAVTAGSPLATVYGDASFAAAVGAAVSIGAQPPERQPLVRYEIDSESSRAADAGAGSTLESK
jgi:pyrimidine-nucleoside phosphorylase/thymidine phosphorylase